MPRKVKTEFEVKTFGKGGAHIIVPRSWIGQKIKLVTESKKQQEEEYPKVFDDLRLTEGGDL